MASAPAAGQSSGAAGFTHVVPRFGRTAAGDFDGDGLADLVGLRGKSLEAVVGPGLFDAELDVLASAQGFGVLSSQGADPRDLILAATSGGLLQLRFENATNSWSSTLISAAWANARLVEVRSMTSAAGVLGVMPDGVSLRNLIQIDGQWIEKLLVKLPMPVVDMTFVQFDGVGQVEVAVAMAGALAVFDQLGNMLAYWSPGGVASVAIGCLEQPASSVDWIAWFLTRSDGSQELRIVSQGGNQPPVAMGLLPMIVEMETGDLDGDGDSDLVFSNKALHHLVLFHDQGDGQVPLFDANIPGSVSLLPIGPPDTPAPDNKARPTLTDVDRDGDLDTLMPVQSTGELFVGHNALVNEEAFEPSVDVDVPLLAANLTGLPSGDVALELKLAVDLPSTVDATHVELIVWRRASPFVPTAPAAVERVLVPLPGSTGGPAKLDAYLLLPAPPDLVPGSTVRCEGMYLWLQRPVKVENDDVTAWWPARVYGMETSPSIGNYNWLKSIGGEMAFSVFEKQNGTTLPDLIGCGSELPNMPNFPEGKVPTWN
jgi:hypothetical protein